jgi:hypothetical protein
MGVAVLEIRLGNIRHALRSLRSLRVVPPGRGLSVCCRILGFLAFLLFEKRMTRRQRREARDFELTLYPA